MIITKTHKLTNIILFGKMTRRLMKTSYRHNCPWKFNRWLFASRLFEADSFQLSFAFKTIGKVGRKRIEIER
jgi:hypothetical protein